MLLMCKDKIVYDIDRDKVVNYNLLPGYMLNRINNPYTFKYWLKLRYSSNTNTLARMLKGVVFGQGNRVLIDNKTHILSLSDCYWVKEDNSNLFFKDISPYYNDFWKGRGEYSENGGAIPTLYVSGFLPKEWVSSEYLYKYGNNLNIEVEVCNLCKMCNISVCDIELIHGGVRVKNFTNPNVMLEQADESGIIDPDDFTESDIIEKLGLVGAQIVIIDAIIGNGDRHAGNFGWLRDSNTGRYIGSAPLYDFDHALDSRLDMDRLIIDAVSAIKKNGYYIQELKRICSIVDSIDTNKIFKKRSKSMLILLSEGK